MTRIKAVVGLAVMVGVLAVSVAPAAAFFESNLKTNSGSGSAGSTTFTAKGIPITCVSAVGTWTIVNSKTQVETKQATHQLVKVAAKEEGWKKCTGPLGVGAEVSAFTFQIKQPNKGQTSGLTAQILSKGTVKAAGCTIEFGETGNQELKEVSGTNSGTNLNATANITGISYTAAGSSCSLLGITTGAAGEFKSTFVAEGEKLI